MTRFQLPRLRAPAAFMIPALLCAATMALPRPAQAQIGIEVTANLAPPPLPEYEQPPMPDEGYLWTPGYWAYGDAGYFWVDGTWVQPPAVGLLWTPGYWGFNGGRYLFNAGYWGATVGFYGGINYGYGYGGFGFDGGLWRDGRLSYNRAVNNFGNVHVTNVYNRTVVVEHGGRESFNGPGGITRQASARELEAAHENHVRETSAQAQRVTMAAHDHTALATVNHGRPAAAAHEAEAGHKTEVRQPPAADRRTEPAARTEPRAHETNRPEPAPHETHSQPAHHTTAPRPEHAPMQHAPRAEPEHRAAPPQHAEHMQAPRPQPEHRAAPPQHAEHMQAPRAPEQHAAPHPEAHEERPR